MIGTGLIGSGLGIYQTIQGAKQAKDAKEALENYNRDELINPAEGLTPSTLGSDLEREEQARLAATEVEALKASGTKGLIGGLGKVEAGNQRLMRDTGADLDRQKKEIDKMVADYDYKIMAEKSARENADIAALSSQFSAGQQNSYSGLGNVVQGTGMVGNNISTPEGDARRQAWRDFKGSNENANRAEFMNNNPRSLYK